MKTFITGGDGLLGSNLIRELLKRKHSITALIQKGRNCKTLDGLNIQLKEGDIMDYNSLLAAANGSEVIFHVAANTSVWPPRNPEINRTNLEGTRNVLKLSKALKIKKLIYVGSANSFDPGSKEFPGTENNGFTGYKYGLDYIDSKWKTHQLVMNSVKEGVNAVEVCPTFMLGPYDSRPSSGEFVIKLYKEIVPGFSPGGKNFINVKDAATGIANALDKGRVGESYIIGNHNLTYKEFVNLTAKVLNVKQPPLKLPRFLVLLYGKINSLISSITGNAPVVSYEMAKVSCDYNYYSSAKAIKELNLPQTDLREGIRECIEWLKQNGYVK